MKSLFVLVLVIFALGSQAQRVRQLSDVTSESTGTDFSQTITVSGGYATLSVDILCTEVGGTTDGNIAIQVRNGSGGNWQRVGEFQSSEYLTITGTGTAAGTDSLLVMNDGDIFHVVFNPAPFYEYRFEVIGTSNDTTTVSFDYLINYTD